jgi:branched-chain amino acid transport system substrate-binding protein
MRGSRVTSRVLPLAAVLMMGVSLAGCGSGEKASQSGQPVLRVGGLLPLTGDSTPSGKVMAAAQRMAVQEANDAGGVLGHRVELITGDDACDPGTAVTEANELVARDITVSVGGYCSSATVPTLKVFRDAGIPMVIPSANSIDLLRPGYDSIFLLSGTTSMEAKHAARWMRELGGTRLALVDDGTSFSETLASETVRNARRPDSGLSVVAELELSQGARRYPRIAAAVTRSRADVVYFTGYYAEAGKFIRDLRASGFDGIVVVGDASAEPGLFATGHAKAVEGVYGTTLPIPKFEPTAVEWATRYRAHTGTEPGGFSMQAYDAVRLALDAVKRAGSLDRAAVRRALAATSPNDIKLLSGPAQFQPDGTQVDPTFVLLRVHDSDFTLVRTSAGKR